MKSCRFAPRRWKDWTDALVIISIVFWFGWLAWAGWKATQVPVVLSGYRVGVDNKVQAGKPAIGLVLLKRDISRDCLTQVRMSFQDVNGVWTAGNDFVASGEAVRAAERKTPGEFWFRIVVPPETPPGKATLHGEAEFVCSDSPLSEIWPARLSASFSLEVE